MKKKYRIPLIIFVLLIIVVVGLLLYKTLFSENEKSNIKIVDSIDNFNYTLDERDSKLMKDTYNELKKVLKAKDIDFEEYAKTLSKLFVIDLFTMNNKINRYDVGGAEYVYPDARENFKMNVRDTIYKTIINNSKGKRKQELPIVSSVDVTDIKETEYNYGDKKMSGYNIELNWNYEKELGYDTKATITLVKDNDMLYVVEYVAGDTHE